jgi:hypothetical protein
MMTLSTIAIAVVSIVIAYVLHKVIQFFVVGYYQVAIGLVEDYIESVREGEPDEELNKRYDDFLKSWNPFKRIMVDVHDMREIRRGEYDFGDYEI